MRFAIGIPCYNGARRVEYLLDSIAKFYSGARDADILVSDDCSPQGEETRKVCEKWGVKFTQPNEWKMVNGNTNHLIRELQADVVAVIQDDILFSKGSMEVMEKFWEDNRFLRIGSVGWTFTQSWELRQVGIIPSIQAFYPTRWNTGEIRRNAYTYHKEQDHPIHEQPIVKPGVVSMPSGVAFAISKLAWQQAGGCFEFGMFEGGLFFEMYDYNWVNLTIPTPPMLHGHRHGATFHADATLLQHWRDHPEKAPGKHAAGEALYEKRRGRTYSEDSRWVEEHRVRPAREAILPFVKYNFDAMDF